MTVGHSGGKRSVPCPTILASLQSLRILTTALSGRQPFYVRKRETHFPRVVKMAILVQSTEDLQKKLEEAGDTLVVIDFYATWCGPCQLFKPQYEAMAELILKVDVNICEEIANEYKINVMPTIIFIRHGKELERFFGASNEKLKAALEKLTS
ncbi:PREDICTED: thioredoxin-like [Habropoda laboriosa]|uniref:thioredoxin-like n=1 Tax=Habropoda laboriosa TaxID=597456 RepID=UPI00083DCD93|nr:PREDICTED: thioredoxin-like [Habropoda laboriosa]